MRKGCVVAIVLIGVLAMGTIADAGPKISASVDGVRGFGYTSYIVPEFRTTERLERERKFPLDVFVTRLNVGVEGAFSGGTPWRLLIDIGKSVNDPGDLMEDTGWVIGDVGDHSAKYLDVESGVELGVWLIDISGRMVFYRRPGFRLEGVLGYGYRTLSYEAFGAEGWLFDPGIEFSEDEALKAHDYEVTYHMPYVGMGARMLLMQTLTIDTELSYSPRTSAKDRHDDHVMHFKTSESDCSGKTIIIALDTIWAPHRGGSGLNWFVGIGTEINYTTTEGDQTQIWFGDDLFTEEDDTGRREPNIFAEIKSSTQSIYLRFGAEL
ncbi:MAG: omptin family outer membrane protease [Candidatus Eisenbacteria bacterium]